MFHARTGNNRGASVNVVLWGAQATLFLGERIYEDGQNSPQIVLFVGALVKKYAGILMKGKCAFGPFLSILVIECQLKCLNVNLCNG
jgi:hypothetical protein